MRSKKTTYTDENVEQNVVEYRWDRALMVLACFLFFISAVLTGVNVWQGTQRNKKIDHIDAVVTEAKRATEASRDALLAALAVQHSPAAIEQARKVNAALLQINENKELLEKIFTLEQQSHG